MPALDPLLIIVLIAIVANTVALAAVILVPLGMRRRRAARRRTRQTPFVSPGTEGGVVEDLGPRESVVGDGVPAATYDRIVRLVSWLVILGTSVFVAVSGLYPETQTAIFVVLAIAGFIVLLVHDILPPGSLGANKFVIEGCLAITLVTLLIILTGQEASPFFFAYVLIVAGAALVVPPAVTVVMAGLASVDYVIGVSVDRDVPLTSEGVATVAINIAAMLLLAFVASYIAREQRRSREIAIRLSTVDSLTGLFNRAYFFAAVEREIQRSSRTGRRFGLLMMDLDGLKAVNDRFGHFQGDVVLKSVSQVIRGGVRRIDTAARYGGDEFVVLLPETEPTGAYVLAEKIRQGVEELGSRAMGPEIRTSLSIGAVSYPDDGLNADELLINADRAMYVSKRQGKNRVVGYVRPDVPIGGRTDDGV